MDYVLHTACLIGIWTLIGSLYVPIVGHGRIFLVSPAMFLGLGAYSYGLLWINFPEIGTLPIFLISFAVSFALTTVASIAIARFWFDDLIVASFALQMMFTSTLTNWRNLTGGALGVGGLAESISLPPNGTLLLVAFGTICLLGLCWQLFYRRYSPLTFALISIGADPVTAASSGVRLKEVRTLALTVAGYLAGIAGILYALLESYVTPTSFDLTESVSLLCVVLVAERRPSILRCFMGACLVIGIPEILRILGFPPSWVGHSQRMAFGAILVAWGWLAKPRSDRKPL